MPITQLMREEDLDQQTNKRAEKNGLLPFFFLGPGVHTCAPFVTTVHQVSGFLLASRFLFNHPEMMYYIILF